MRSTPISRISRRALGLALCLSLLFGVVVLGSGSSASAATATAQPAQRTSAKTTAPVVPGCSAFRGATTLGTSYYDGRIRVYTCGQRPSFDGARNGGGAVVRPYAGSPIYYRGIVVSSKVNARGNGTVRAVEQNWGGPGGTRGAHRYQLRKWRVVFPGLPHIKWLRSR